MYDSVCVCVCVWMGEMGGGGGCVDVCVCEGGRGVMDVSLALKGYK